MQSRIRPARMRQMCDSIGVDYDGFIVRNKSKTYDRKEPTHIYVMSCSKWAKIGIAADVSARLERIQSNCPIKISVEFTHSFPSRLYALIAEAEAHKALADARIHGEWFFVRPSRAVRVAKVMSAAVVSLIDAHAMKDIANDNKARAIAMENNLYTMCTAA